MHELDELRQIAPLIRQPPLAAIAATARRRRRQRAAVTVAAIGAAFAVLVAGGALLTGYVDRTAPQPAGDTTPGRLTPKEIVTGANSRLVTAATSLDDPDVRIAVWEATCKACTRREGSESTKLALALTTDGFTTTTYAASPDLSSPGFRFAGAVGPRIESPAEDLFLYVDDRTPAAWLVGTDGTVRPVERTSTPLAPTDRRLWFRCHPAEPPAPGQTPIGPLDPTSQFPWCALDPDAGTAYEWPARWNGSVALPNSGREPWGIDVRVQPTYAWWYAGGQQQRRFLADSPGDARGPVWNAPNGGPMFFTRTGFEPDLDLLVPDGGTGLRAIMRDAPNTPPSPLSAQFDLMLGTPEGALLAVQTYPQTAVWRAENLASGDFQRVHSGRYVEPVQLAVTHEPTIVDNRIHVMTPKGALISDDDGRTWTEIATWR